MTPDDPDRHDETPEPKPGAETLLPLVYEELRGLADRYLRNERTGHTLQATALVHEAWMKLRDQRVEGWNDRSHFLGVAALAMRRILINHAKAKHRIKRGGGQRPVVLEETMAVFNDRAIDLVALDEALTRLAEVDARQAKIVELRFFAGLSIEEIAEVLNASERTVHRDWAMARAWLRGEIAEAGE